MVDATHYTYRLEYSPDDGEYVATAAEFPSLSWLAPSQPDALAGLVGLIDDVLTDLQAAGEPVPQPLSERPYSGKFQVRVGPALHRRLVVAAAEERVSLNRYVSDQLSRSVSS